MSRVEQFERIRRDHRLEGLSIRTLARRHQVHRRTVRQALASAIPPKRVVSDRPSPAFGPYEHIVRRWLIEDKSAPKKQRHTARRVCAHSGDSVHPVRSFRTPVSEAA